MEKQYSKMFDYYFDCTTYATKDCKGDCENCNFHPDYIEEVKYQKEMEHV